MEQIEYHLVEDFATDWTDGQDWEGFFLFFNHCARELLLLAAGPMGKNPPVQLEWAVHAEPRMHWIYGTTHIPPDYQYGSTPLHRAAGARQPKLLAQVLASIDPSDLDVRGTPNPPLFRGELYTRSLLLLVVYGSICEAFPGQMLLVITGTRRLLVKSRAFF